jgi:mono/diheme cytochrome c family protein
MKMNLLEIKGAAAGILAAVFALVVTFTAAGIYRRSGDASPQPGNQSVDPGNLAVQGRRNFLQSCAHCHGRDADGGEDAPSLLKLQISSAHMSLVIQNGIKGEMPSFAKKYGEQDTASLVAYLKTLD